MGTIYFTKHAIRQLSDGRAVLFSWPDSLKTFTYTVSIDGGKTFSAGVETITENPPDGGIAEYEIPYNVNERPETAGTVVYAINDGTNTAKLYVNVLSSVPTAITAPAVPGGDQLTSKEEMERTFSVQGVANHVDDYVDPTELISEIVVRASETVMGYLRDRYDLTELTTSSWARMRATWVALYYLSLRRGDPSLFADQYAEALMDVAQARDGHINIGIGSPLRMMVQTPIVDNRLFNAGRIDPNRSTKVFPGQKIPYRIGPYE